MDIFEISSANSTMLEAGFQEISERASDATRLVLHEFVKEIKENGRVSVNIRPWVMGELLRHNAYLNIYEAVEEDATLTSRQSDDILRERLGLYYKKRILFDQTFNDGRRFRYGALNIGGPGTPRYGTFCTVLADQPLHSANRVAYLKMDSLRGFTTEEAVDLDAIRTDTAAYSHRQYLAAVKHAHELIGLRSSWARMLCTENEYIEVVFIAELNSQLIQEVRITARDRQLLWDLCFVSHGRKLSEPERALAHDFRQILLALKELNIPLVETPDV